MDPVPVTPPDLDDRVEGSVGDLDQRVNLRRRRAVASEQGVLGFAHGGVDDRAVFGVELTAQLPPSVVAMPHRQTLHRLSNRPLIVARGIVGGRRRSGSGRRKSYERITRRSCVTVANLANSHNSPIRPTWRFGGDRRDLIQRQLTGVERRERHRQIATTPRHRNQLLGVSGRQAGFPRQPMRRATRSRASPTPRSRGLRRRAPPVVRQARCGGRTDRRGGPRAVPAFPPPSPYRTHVRSTTQPAEEDFLILAGVTQRSWRACGVVGG